MMAHNLRSLNQHLRDVDGYLQLIDERLAKFAPPSEPQPEQPIEVPRARQAEPGGPATRRTRSQDDHCPYRGLEFFDEQHAVDYHGRASMMANLLARLQQTNFVTVVGPSGCGKSSLVRAGLLPALRRDATWDIEVLRPGEEPLFSLAVPLAARLAPDLSPAERLAKTRKVAEHLLSGDAPMGGLLDQIRQQNPDAPRFALIIDQFEEAFTSCGDEASCQAFLAALLGAAEASWVTVILALRADFFGRVLGERTLGPRVDRGQVNMLPMTAAERREAIVQPASRAGRSFEPGLVQRISDAAEDLPAELPLLQVALTELWARQRADGMLTHAAYEAMGRVSQAVASRADAIYWHFTPAEQEGVRAAFTRLVRVARPDEETGDTLRRVALTEVAPGSEPLVRQLVARRLLVAARDPETRRETVEIAHEALLREWGPLQEWLNRDREFLLWRQRLRASAALWNDGGRKEEGLLRGATLLEAVARWGEWQGNLDMLERVFVVESRRLAVEEATLRREQAHAQALAEERQRNVDAGCQRAEAERQHPDGRKQAVQGQRQRVPVRGIALVLTVVAAIVATALFILARLAQ